MADFFYKPMFWFIERPFLAFLPALMFLAAYAHHRFAGGRQFRLARFIVAGAAGVWLIYALYEWRMYYWAKTVSSPIRVDLLLIAPALWITSGVGLVAYGFGFPRSLSRFSK